MKRAALVILMAYGPAVVVALLSLAWNWTHGGGSFWPGVLISIILGTMQLPLFWAVWGPVPERKS